MNKLANYLVKKAKKESWEDLLSDEEYKQLFGVPKPPGALALTAMILGTLGTAAGLGYGGYKLTLGSGIPAAVPLLAGTAGGSLLANWLERKITGGYDSGLNLFMF